MRKMARGQVIAALTLVLAACVPAQPAASPSPATATPPAAATLVVPKATEEPTTRSGLATFSYSHPDIEHELRSYFDRFYKARTLPRGGQFDVAALRGLVEGPYADYTMALFDREVADANAGRLLEVSFTDLEVAIGYWNRADLASANVSRTRVELRSGAAVTRDTATYMFSLHRQLFGADGVVWTAYDFFDPAASEWISVTQPISDAKATTELLAFFTEFYAARSLSPGHPLDYYRSQGFVAGSYGAYTMALLEQTKAEAASGVLKEVRYSDIAVKLQSWDPKATYHGGLAMVQVTRTAFVTRASGAVPPQLATYQFRVHRHANGLQALWLAVDFFRPDVGRWVTEIAGATVIVPEAGHA